MNPAETYPYSNNRVATATESESEQEEFRRNYVDWVQFRDILIRDMLIDRKKKRED